MRKYLMFTRWETSKKHWRLFRKNLIMKNAHDQLVDYMIWSHYHFVIIKLRLMVINRQIRSIPSYHTGRNVIMIKWSCDHEHCWRTDHFGHYSDENKSSNILMICKTLKMGIVWSLRWSYIFIWINEVEVKKDM